MSVLQTNGPPQYANGGWGDPRDQQLCKHFAGQAEVPIGTAPMQHVAPLSQISVQEAPARAEVSASRVRVPEATEKAQTVNLGQANPSVGVVSAFLVRPLPCTSLSESWFVFRGRAYAPLPCS